MTVDAWERGLAGGAALLSQPPYVRQGWTELVTGQVPAAGASFTRRVPNDAWERMLAVAFTFAPSATAAFRNVLLQWMDGDGNVFAQVPVTGLVTANRTITAFGSFAQPSIVDFPQDQGIYGTQNAPAANTTIASATAVPPGQYLVEWSVELSGTLAAGTDNDNFKLAINGVQQARSLNPAVAGVYPQANFTLDLVASSTVSIANIGAATAASVYAAEANLIPTMFPAASVEIPDLTMKSGWQFGISVTNIQAGDQLSGISLLVERYPSSVAAGIVP